MNWEIQANEEMIFMMLMAQALQLQNMQNIARPQSSILQSDLSHLSHLSLLGIQKFKVHEA